MDQPLPVRGRISPLPLAIPQLAILLAGGGVASALVALRLDFPPAAAALWDLSASALLWLGAVPGAFLIAAAVLPDKRANDSAPPAVAFAAGSVVVASAELRVPPVAVLVARFVALAIIAVFLARLWQRLIRETPVFFPPAAAARYAVAFLTVAVAGLAVCDFVAAFMPRPMAFDWLREALRDACYLAPVLPYLVALRTLPAGTRGPSLPSLPPAWLGYLIAYLFICTAAVPLQCWLWRFPGAAATPGVLAVAGGLVVVAVLVLWPRAPAAADHGAYWYAVADVAAATAALVSFAVAVVAAGLRQNIPILHEQPIGFWMLGYRWALGFAAVSATALCAGRFARHGSASVWARLLHAVLPAAFALAHLHWMLAPSGAADALWLPVALAIAFGGLTLAGAGARPSAPPAGS